MEHTARIIAGLYLCGTSVEGKFVDSAVKLTERVKLECIYPKKATIIQASWMKLNVTHKENITVLHPIYGIQIEEKNNRRISFENASREDKSLSFITSTLQDVGFYFCSIVTYPDGIWEKVIEKVLPDVFEESYKQNNPKPGENVAFTCPCKIGDSVLQVMWERIKADQVDIVVLCSSSGKQSFGSDFKECTLVDCSDQANSKIVIQNTAASDFATYRCAETKLTAGRNKTHVMSFTVATTWDQKWFVISIAGGISAAVLRKKRKRITEAFSNDLYPTQMQPCNSYESSNFHGTWNTGRREEESSLGQTEEIHVNCKNVSLKPKKRPLDLFLGIK